MAMKIRLKLAVLVKMGNCFQVVVLRALQYYGIVIIYVLQTKKKTNKLIEIHRNLIKSLKRKLLKVLKIIIVMIFKIKHNKILTVNKKHNKILTVNKKHNKILTVNKKVCILNKVFKIKFRILKILIKINRVSKI